MIKLSNAALNVIGQPMFNLLDKVEKLERAGKSIIHFELGEPDFDTPANITDACINSLNNGNTHYVNSKGLFKFREAIVKTTIKSRGFEPSIEQVLVTPGANAIVYLAISCIANPGDEVIIPDPGFPTYYSALSFCGVKPVTVPLHEINKFQLDPEDLEKKITNKTRMIIINSPSNPTGSIIPPDSLKKIAEICEKNNIFLLSDEIYGRMKFQKEDFFCPGSLDSCKHRTIILNGFSKAFAMTGWRLGVAIGPEPVIEKMSLALQTIVSCVPPFIQDAGIEAITGDQSAADNMMIEYKKRRDLLVDGLNKINGIRCILPEGALYAFPNIEGTGFSSEEFANYILEKAGVALLPGTNFGKMGEGFIRMCYVTKEQNILEGLSRISSALR